MTTTTGQTPAPLAQLRDADEETWRHVYAATTSANPGLDIRIQALAAALLGDIGLAKRLLALEGPGAIFDANWPDLRPTPPRDLDIRTAISAGILALNTLQYPDATSEDDGDWLDAMAEDAVSLLCRLRNALPEVSESSDLSTDVVATDCTADYPPERQCTHPDCMEVRDAADMGLRSERETRRARGDIGYES